MEELNKILQSSKDFLGQCRTAAEAAAKDPIALQWQAIDFDQMKIVLLSLGIPMEINSYRKRYLSKASEIIKITILLKNELDNLRMESNSKTSPTKSMLGIIQNFDQQCRQHLAPLMASFTDQQTNIHLAAKGLKEEIHLENFMELALLRTPLQQKELFHAGRQNYEIIVSDKARSGEALTLQNHFAEAVSLEKQLQEIELPEMPLLVRDNIAHQITIGLDATATVKNFIDGCREAFQKEIHQVAEFNARLVDLRPKEIITILNQVESLADNLSTILRNFYYQHAVIKEINKIALLLFNLKLFVEALQGDLPKQIASQCRLKNAPLNPDTIACKMSRDFFHGIKGLIRMFKLILGMLMGKTAVSEQELQNRLKLILESCPFDYSSDAEAINKMKKALDSHFAKYSKPFPYNELFLLGKKSIATYSETVKQALYQHKIQNNPSLEQTHPPSPVAIEPAMKTIGMGRLIGRIEVRTASLQNTLAAWENKE